MKFNAYRSCAILFIILPTTIMVNMVNSFVNGPPHQFNFKEGECKSCHASFYEPKKLVAPINDICNKCHGEDDAISHVVGIVPSMYVRDDFPLDEEAKMTCNTCHNIHMERIDTQTGKRTYLLRIDAIGKPFCDECHKETMEVFIKDTPSHLSTLTKAHFGYYTSVGFYTPGGVYVDSVSRYCMSCHSGDTACQSAVSFSNSDLRLLSIIAAQSAQLIKNSQLQQEVIEKNRLKQELELARKIQQELLPKSPPEFPFLEFATFFNPAEEVGGDFFDYIPLSQEKLAVVQADVSGHGLSAALIMTMLKGIFQSISHDFISPDQTLTQINEILGNSAPPEIFVTMIFLVFDSEKRVLHITNAGHNPPLVYLHKEEKLEYLKIPGCALNCMKSAEYRSHKISLNAGDFIFLYTDGLPESPDKQFELFGYERLQKIVHQARDTDVKNILQEVKTALYRHLQQVPQTDDIAINILKVN